MFSTVIAGYDGSPAASGAIELARVLSEPEGVVQVVAAYLHRQAVGRVAQYERMLDHDAEAAAREALARLPLDPRATATAVPGASPARALTELAERVGADLVVIGSTHHGPLGRAVLGTTAQRLLHGATCAVAIAPAGYAARAIRHVGVAYDGSAEADSALARGYATAAELRAALTLYTVAEPVTLTYGAGATAMYVEDAAGVTRDRAQALLERAADRAPAGVTPERVLLEGRPAAAIADRASGVVDLLLVGSRGYGPLRRVLLGSVSGALLARADVPIVVLPRAATAADPARAREAATTAS